MKRYRDFRSFGIIFKPMQIKIVPFFSSFFHELISEFSVLSLDKGIGSPFL